MPIESPRTRVFRFAPSPNGLLHLGHAYSALRNQTVAARCGGTLLLRIENIDRERCKPAFEAAIEDDLAWLGFSWAQPVLRQSDRLASYQRVLASLRAEGLLYPCFCTRGVIAEALRDRPGWPRDPDGSPLYPGLCRSLPEAERRRRMDAGEPAALRLDLARALVRLGRPLSWEEFGEGSRATSIDATVEDWGDVLLARKDIGTSYHIAVVVDDAGQGITDIVRGADLKASTSVHRLLQGLLGYAAPAYHHHRLILDASGAKLSKSAGSPSLRSLRESGTSAAAVRRQLGFAPL